MKRSTAEDKRTAAMGNRAPAMPPCWFSDGGVLLPIRDRHADTLDDDIYHAPAIGAFSQPPRHRDGLDILADDG